MMNLSLVPNIVQEQSIKLSQKQKTKLTAKTIHQKEWGIENYMDIFQIPDHVATEIQTWIVQLTSHLSKHKTIKILSPGCGGARNELLVIDALMAKYPNSRIECDLIDYSESSVQQLNKSLQQLYYELLGNNISKSKHTFIKENVTINVIYKDYENWLDEESSKKQYDVILAFFLINFLSDWRLSLINTVKLLKDKGVLILSQDIGDYCFIDNTFRKEKKENQDWFNPDFLNFWKEYYHIRQVDYGLDWNSLISPSNMEFVENVFNEVSIILQNKSKEISKSFYWTLDDMSTSCSLESYDFWLKLVKGGDNVLDVFNCLSIVPKARQEIFEKLKEYQNKKVENLYLGQKLFSIQKQRKICDNYDDVFKYVLYKNNFQISTVTNYKFLNRKDRSDDQNILRSHLLNRGLDIYHCYVQNNNKSMVSLFSRKQIIKDGKQEFSWENSITPIVFPLSFDKNQRKSFFINYGLYFKISELLKQQKNIERLFTGILHEVLSEKIGLILTIRNEGESVIPIFLNSSDKLKAIQINLSEVKVSKLYKSLLNFKKSIESELSFNFDQLDFVISNDNNYFFLTDLNKLKESLVISEEKFNEIDQIVIGLVDDKFASDIVDLLCQYMPGIEDLKELLMPRFKRIYLILLTHMVQPNIIIYTSTNATFDEEQHKEIGYYGLILADRIPVITDDVFISNYYDQLLANTFTYSGMDGIHETKKVTEILAKEAEWESIFTETFHTLKKFIGGLRYVEKNILSNNQSAIKALEYFRNQINILLELSRYSYNPKEYKDKFQKTEFTLYDVFNPLIEMYEFAGLNFPSQAFKIGYSDQLKEVLNSKSFWQWKPNDFKNITIIDYKEIYDLVFADVLLNAIENNQPTNLWIKLEAVSNNDKIIISISNNSAIFQSFKESFIKRMFDPGHLGIKIICKWADALNWHINLPNASHDKGGKTTKIEFIISKVD